MAYGDPRPNERTGIGTRSLFGAVLHHNLEDGFPLLTCKSVPWKPVVSELLFFIEGSSDERRLAEILHGTRDPSKRTIWTDNAHSDYWESKAAFDGDLGRVYGVQWRSWRSFDILREKEAEEINGVIYHYCAKVKETHVDQLSRLIETIKTNPSDRRLILSALNVGEFDQMALPPCHVLAQFYVSTDRKLSCQVYQRSADLALGVPFNIASYALLTHLIAHVTGLGVGTLRLVLGDAHVYVNHMDGVQTLIERGEQLVNGQIEPYALPTLELNPEVKDIDSFTMSDITLLNYKSLPKIHFEMAV
jgi:thymidylate synthase